LCKTTTRIEFGLSRGVAGEREEPIVSLARVFGSGCICISISILRMLENYLI
jgi:hypothetical protein